MIAPASTNKLFTAAVALKMLGPDFRYVTKLQWVHSGSVAAHLKIIGSGDPTLTLGELTELFARLADQLSSSGITQVYGDLLFAATADRWSERTIPEGWNRGKDLRNGDGTLGGAMGLQSEPRIKAALRAKLSAKGIAWASDAASFAPFTGPVEELTHESSELRKLLRPMLLMSINCHAEAHLRKVGEMKGSHAMSLHAAGLEVMREFVGAHNGENTFQLYDGSGLSRKSRVNADGLVHFLEEMKAEPFFSDLVSGLPIAGQTGTLRRRMRDSSAGGRVRAKTGTLDGNYQLAGYLAEPTKNGTEYHPFAILSETSSGNGSYVRSVTDGALGSLASYMLRN
jgi:D-alanyl-D-alanine carboxypeptidase/D-alanyl-D-alanine-endopeptidase (penicillin-binding protein 4)